MCDERKRAENKLYLGVCSGDGVTFGDGEVVAFCGVCGLCGDVCCGLGECGKPTMRLCLREALSVAMFSPLLAATTEARLLCDDISSDG